MTIIITSMWFEPELNPRAFRTTELVKGFLNKGHKVILFVPKSAITPKSKKLEVVKINYSTSTDSATSKDIRKSSYFINILKKSALFFLGESSKSIKYSFHLFMALSKHLQKHTDADLVLSIGLPFYIHLSTLLATKLSNITVLKVADCGDPFYYNPAYKKAYYFKHLDKWTLNQFDYVAIPTNNALNTYSKNIPSTKLKIIPQAFELLDIDNKVPNNPIPTFCYAGVFYESIRNPSYFFEWLSTLHIDFLFIVYALPSDFTKSILDKYGKLLGDKLIVREPLPRKKLLYELAKMDFLVCFSNDHECQRPSKLIDYSLTHRPIISFNQANFSPSKFSNFLNGNYEGRENIDPYDYDIKKIVSKFESLYS